MYSMNRVTFAVVIVCGLHFVVTTFARRYKSAQSSVDENCFAKYVLQAVSHFQDIILFDTSSIKEIFDRDDAFAITSGASWEILVKEMNKVSNSSGNQTVALRLHNTVEIGDVIEMLQKNGLSVNAAMAQASKPFVITNGGGENWGLLSTGNEMRRLFLSGVRG